MQTQLRVKPVSPVSRKTMKLTNAEEIAGQRIEYWGCPADEVTSECWIYKGRIIHRFNIKYPKFIDA